MRKTFIKTLSQLAEEDERLWLLTADLGYSVLEDFATRFPGRFLNVGVAEQNMTGLAAGLALCGKVVVTYSIANFPTIRCLEQVRNDVCHHNLAVKIVAVGAGLAYGPAGYSHQAVEDLAVMRAMPNMTVFSPGDPMEVQAATRVALDLPGPCYLRLSHNNEPNLHREEPVLRTGKPLVLKKGGDMVLISTGGILAEAAQAADLLLHRGIKTTLVSMPFLKPVDQEAVAAILRGAKVVMVVEEHSAIGGLGSVIAEIIASQRLELSFIHHHLPECLNRTGSKQELRRYYNLDAEGIFRRYLDLTNSDLIPEAAFGAE